MKIELNNVEKEMKKLWSYIDKLRHSVPKSPQKVVKIHMDKIKEVQEKLDAVEKKFNDLNNLVKYNKARGV